MSARPAVHTGLLKAAANRTPCVLATVVRTLGSAYMGVGAQMVVHADGTTVGMVSGGCLEADLAARAPDVLAAGIPRVVLYDARSPDDLVWGLGLGCEGLVEVLLEPLLPDDAGSLARLLRRGAVEAGAAVLATVYRTSSGGHLPPVGARCLLGPSGAIMTSPGWGDPGLLADVSREYAFVDDRNVRGWTRGYEDGALEIAFEIVQPTVHLVICGAGPDAASVARLAHELGWRCTVISGNDLDRPGVRARFPHAELVPSSRTAMLRLACEQRTAAIVMSHRYELDREYLGSLLETGVRYIGVLGPRRRTDRMLAELAFASRGADEGNRDRVHGPAGLDIGGEGPELIALAIVAEVAAVMHGRDGGQLRQRSAPIHDMMEGPTLPDASVASASPRRSLGTAVPG